MCGMNRQMYKYTCSKTSSSNKKAANSMLACMRVAVSSLFAFRPLFPGGDFDGFSVLEQAEKSSAFCKFLVVVVLRATAHPY